MSRFLDLLRVIEGQVLGLGLLALALLACVQVFTRYVLSYSFTWFQELSQFACVLLTFMGAGMGITQGAHFSMTAIADRLQPRVRGAVSALVWTLCAVFFAAVAYYGALHCLKHYKFGNLSPALRIPMFIPYLPIPFFSALMVVRSLAMAGLGLAAAAGREPKKP